MKNFSNKKYLWSICFAVILTAFTAYVALDTFLIPRAYQMVESQAAVEETTEDASDSTSNTLEHTIKTSPVTKSGDAEVSELSETAQAETEPVITDTSYTDGNVSIELTTYYEYGTSIYVADIQAASVEFLKAAFADDTYGRNITAATSEIASDNGAILAVNGDYYGSQQSGYVIRNGVLYRSTARSGQEDLVIYSDGTFELINENDVTAEELLDAGAWQVFSFGPGILEAGEITVSETEEVGKAMASNPRTAIGFIDDTHYVLVVSDGRTNESEGLSLYELAEFMQSLGVSDAYNLDGGGSSTMYFNGMVVNNPTTNGRSIKERGVSDIIYF